MEFNSKCLYCFHSSMNKPKSSNPGKRNPDDENRRKHQSLQQKSFANEKAKTVVIEKDVSQNILFKRGMNEREVKKELFLLEGEEGFEEKSLRGKMTVVIKKSCKELSEKFYDLGVEERLPVSWTTFKEFVVSYCTEQGIDSVRKFGEETWSKYLLRLREWARMRNIPDESIFKKMRSENLPQPLQVVFYSVGLSFETAVNRIEEWELFNSQRGFASKKTSSVKNDEFISNIKEKRPIKCFKCGEMGHYKSECRVKDMSSIRCFKCQKLGHYSNHCKDTNINNNVELNVRSDIDERKVKIQNKIFKAVFDTGASESMICSGVLKKLKNFKLNEEKREYFLFNGKSDKTMGNVDLVFIYKGKEYEENFNVVNDDSRINILLCNRIVKEIEGKSLNNKIIPGECSIDTQGAGPVSWSRPIRNHKDLTDFRVLIRELEEKGIIEPSTSNWLNPVVLVRKRDGTLRFCVDFQRLNDLVPQDNFEIPKISELIVKLRDMRYFTRLDLKDGFFQIPIREADKEKTTFYTGERLMQFKKMPQGYKNSPAIFQRTMNLIFGDMIGAKCVVYIDDILVFGKDYNEHNENLKCVLGRIKMYGLNENLDKRQECVEQVTFLGYEIELNKMRPTVSRAQGIMEYETPRSKKSLQRFLGMINFDRCFVRNITEEIKPLYEALGAEKKFSWNAECESAFIKIKEKWKENLELYIPDQDGLYELETDASNIGIGAVLMQNGKPVVYISRCLTKAEQNYSITEKEVLASLWAMEKLQYYLFGKPFILITDHKAIEELKFKKEFGSSRIQRWFERLEKFQFKVEYRPGVKITVADALSRSKSTPKKGEESYTDKIREKVFTMHKNLNHRKKIREEIRKIGIEISEKKLEILLKECTVCALKDRKNESTCYHVKTDRPGQLLGVDVLQITPKDKIVVAIDYFSRKLFAKNIETKEDYKIVVFLNEVWNKFPIEEIISDNGKEFSNKEVEHWIKEKGIRHKFSIPYYHKSNGRVERANRTLREALKKTSGPVRVKLSKVVDNYNNIRHRGVGMTPNEATIKENWEKVRFNETAYEKEFARKMKKVSKLNIGDNVLVRNEFKEGKMDDEFFTRGIIVKNIYGNVYLVKTVDGQEIKRHIVQLKLLKKGEVGYAKHIRNIL